MSRQLSTNLGVSRAAGATSVLAELAWGPMGYMELGIIFFGSIGAALLLGTGAALLRYRRTGEFPGQPEDAPPEDTAQAVRAAKVRITFGTLLLIAGAWTLASVL